MSVFGGQLAALKGKPAPVNAEPAAEVKHDAPALITSPAPAPAKRARVGKISNPEYKARTVLINKKLQRQAENKWADEEHQSEDLSDIVEHALKLYLAS